MKPQDKMLVKKMAVVLVIKMVVLTASWVGLCARAARGGGRQCRYDAEAGDRAGSTQGVIGVISGQLVDLSRLQFAATAMYRFLFVPLTTAFVASTLTIVGVIGTAGASMFPFIMPSSTLPAASLTVWDSVSTHLMLGIMFWATVLLIPLIVVYTSWAYHVMRGKVTAAYIRENNHAAY